MANVPQRKQLTIRRRTQLENLSDYTLADICQMLLDEGNYQAVAHFIRTSQKHHLICQPILNRFIEQGKLDPINIKFNFEWLIGSDVEWSELGFKNPNPTILYGTIPYTFVIGTLHRPQEDGKSVQTIQINGPITLQQLVDKVNLYFKTTMQPMIKQEWENEGDYAVFGEESVILGMTQGDRQSSPKNKTYVLIIVIKFEVTHGDTFESYVTGPITSTPK